jgi:hypothetical protein
VTAHLSFGTFAATGTFAAGRWLLQLAMNYVLFGKIACSSPCSFESFSAVSFTAIGLEASRASFSIASQL